MDETFGWRRKIKLWLLKDKFGVSWQIVPLILGELLNDEDDERSQRAMQAMLKMNKLNIKKLKPASR